jgi:hypothetical protein
MTISAERRRLEIQAEIVLDKLAQLDELERKYGGEDQFKPGDVITFNYRFDKTGRNYSYAALFVNGLWYTTGPRSPKGYTWLELVAWWERGKVSKLKVVTARKTFA